MSDHFSNDSKHVSPMFFGPAKVVQGSELPESELLALAKTRYPGKKLYLLRHWIIIDILSAEGDAERTIPTDMHPVVVYCACADAENQQGGSEGREIVSDYQITLDGCFFETRNITYILTGSGFRQCLDSRLVQTLGASQPGNFDGDRLTTLPL